jgi:DNA-binding response OmpR family regulator
MPLENELPLILLVEPDRHLGRIIAAYLERDGCRVTRVDSLPGAAAARGAAPSLPELLIVDLDHLDTRGAPAGIEALAAVPVMLLASGPVPPPSARQPGAAPILRKPFTMRELRRAVHAFLRGAGSPVEPALPLSRS